MTERADKLLYIRGLAKSRSAAQTLIEQHLAYADGRLILKASEVLPTECDLSVKDGLKYVSRGGLKLQGAIEHFKIDVDKDTCADIGASTGGFTDCLLRHGAAKVYAVDCGKDQLDPTIKNDKRVISIEGVNARYLSIDMLGEYVDTVVMDVSFISQTLLHKSVCGIIKPGGKLISLIKPQFEAGREYIGKRGIALPSCYDDVKSRVVSSAAENGLNFVGVCESAIRGGDGNVEFLAYFRKK